MVSGKTYFFQKKAPKRLGYIQRMLDKVNRPLCSDIFVSPRGEFVE